MIYAVKGHVQQIYEGRKTQTRRTWHDDDELFYAPLPDDSNTRERCGFHEMIRLEDWGDDT